MKRWIPWVVGLAVLACVVVVWLFQPAVDPERYTGTWYGAEDACVYQFQEGVIECREHGISLSDGRHFSGAYCFSRNRILVFTMEETGPGDIQELYLSHSAKGDMLSEKPNGAGAVHFYRSREAVPSE